MRFKLKTLLLLFAALILSPQDYAFEINGRKWPTGETEYYVDMDGVAASGISWNTAFIDAMNEWNEETSFNFVLREENRDPCTRDDLSSVDFAEDFCGTEFSEDTLAVTIRRFEQSILGEPPIVEADIVVNQTKEFNVYDGNLIQFGIQGLDFRRVALHELGHVIGLEHESDANAIMAPNISDLDRLQEDDIAGAEELYDGVIDCAISDLTIGVTNNALGSDDCKVNDLYAGSSDDSAIDLYRFELTNVGTLSLSMTSPGLDSVLLIADENLQVVGFDENSSEQCDSTLSQFLQPGSYFLLANTFTEQIKDECGVTGDYQITASLSSSGLNPLGSTASLSGAIIDATFSGGITANNGSSFTNSFQPDDSLDISARIDIDPQHVGEAGFLVIAALVDDQVLFLNEQGQFVDFAANPGVIIHAENKILVSEEQITIVENLVPSSLGFSEIQVAFHFGYGIDSNPDELFFHQAPLNLFVSP